MPNDTSQHQRDVALTEPLKGAALVRQQCAHLTGVTVPPPSPPPMTKREPAEVTAIVWADRRTEKKAPEADAAGA